MTGAGCFLLALAWISGASPAKAAESSSSALTGNAGGLGVPLAAGSATPPPPPLYHGVSAPAPLAQPPLGVAAPGPAVAQPVPGASQPSGQIPGQTPGQAAGQAASGGLDAYSWSSYLWGIGLLFFILAVLWALLAFLKTRGKLFGGQSVLSLESRMALSKNQSLLVVNFSGKRLLLGVAEQNISLLAEGEMPVRVRETPSAGAKTSSATRNAKTEKEPGLLSLKEDSDA